jgi:hypothetical protein
MGTPDEWPWPCLHRGRGEPFIVRKLATKMPAFKTLAEDKAIRKVYANARLSVIEKGHKREDRRNTYVNLTLSQFLDQYREGTAEKSLLAVSPVPAAIAADIHLPPWLACGGGLRRLYSLNLWMSSGGTDSVMHSDMDDNLNCVFAPARSAFIWRTAIIR